ncbi:MAG: HAMP domain-containing protein [Betaproteobacteria bacterium]
MADQKQQRRNRNVFILPDFQGRMILFVLLTGFICMTLNSYLYYQYVVDSYDFILRHSSLSPDLKDQRYSDLLVFGISLGVATLVATLAVAIWALFASHRAAGSIYHLKRVIDEIKSGNVNERVHLREKDQFQDLARSFNEMMDQMRKQ